MVLFAAKKFFGGGQKLKVVVNSGDLQKVVKKVPQICRHNVTMVTFVANVSPQCYHDDVIMFTFVAKCRHNVNIMSPGTKLPVSPLKPISCACGTQHSIPCTLSYRLSTLTGPNEQ